ncbi:PREDICTED: SH2 domain-containing protein 1B-like, partial [Tauraco erythrolophus]|uniref:SH2 domain-containing protein 1B-like n=1 Tax=Tauraco erythrolophus TaxID=121530 RepID=UPI000523E574
TSEGVPERIFRTLKDLIYTYEKPNQGLVTHLRYPVQKTKASQRSQRFKSGRDSIYAEVDDSDYVTVLP